MFSHKIWVRKYGEDFPLSSRFWKLNCCDAEIETREAVLYHLHANSIYNLKLWCLWMERGGETIWEGTRGGRRPFMGSWTTRSFRHFSVPIPVYVYANSKHSVLRVMQIWVVVLSSNTNGTAITWCLILSLKM